MKTIYLTIDDGPSKDRKEKVDILFAYGIQPLWFCIGNDMENNPEGVLYSIEKGGIIGNHSYSHPRFSQIPLDECFAEIERTDLLIEKFYKEAGVPRPFKAFRFPCGDKGEEHNFFRKPYSEKGLIKIQKIQAFLKEMGYVKPNIENINYSYYKNLGLKDDIDWYWTYDVTEWCIFQEKPMFGIRTIEDVFEVMELDLPERWAGLNYPYSDDIILLHDHPQTSNIFGPIIQRMITKELNFGKIFV